MNNALNIISASIYWYETYAKIPMLFIIPITFLIAIEYSIFLAEKENKQNKIYNAIFSQNVVLPHHTISIIIATMSTIIPLLVIPFALSIWPVIVTLLLIYIVCKLIHIVTF